MDTMQSSHTRRQAEARPHRIARPLLTAALACFALPFLTVTCYGDDVTVSGIQAATTVDITPQETPDPGDRQFAQEGEPPNVLAIVAFLATAMGLALSFGSRALRRAVVWAAAVGVIALEGVYLYAYARAWGEALPDVGFAAAMTLLAAAAWLGVERVPTWIAGGVVLVGAATVPYSVLPTQSQMENPLSFLAFVAGSIAAVGLAVGAIRTSAHPIAITAERPTTLRIVLAGVVAVVCLGTAGVAALFLLGPTLSSEGDTSVASSYVFAIPALVVFVGLSLIAWVAGRAIVRPRRRAALAVGLPVAQG